MAPECILIADDLTGACDTGVQFARHSFSSEVWVDPSHAVNKAAEVVAFNIINIDGPHGPDTIFLLASRGTYDLVVAIYHDQGHI